ncbi:MAG TPA: class I SAM-dependent methyltransferase [Candidatus Deferrimicrobiaceae bacterium]|jgi:SAM-dependent methyltransferase
MAGLQFRRSAGIALLVLGTALLATALLGRWTGLGRYPSCPPVQGERFSPALAARTNTLDALYREAESRASVPLATLPPEKRMLILDEVVSERFTHGALSEYNFFGNWLFRVAGRYRKGNLHIEDPDTLLRLGHSALCDETSFLLYRLAEKAGIPARHAFLEGHALMEAQYDGGWHAFDPDMEVRLRDDAGSVASVEWMRSHPDAVRAAYAARGGEEYGNRVARIFSGPVRYIVYPAQTGFSVKGQRPGRAERLAASGQFVIPLAIMALGAVLAYQKRGNASRPGTGAAQAKDGVRQHFDTLADDYDDWKRKASYYYSALAGIYGEFIPEGASVLEVGCGTGTLLASLRPRRGVGIDISERMVGIAAAKFPGLKFVTADAERFDPGETFDFVIVPDVIEHLSDVPAMFRSARRCCHEGSRVIVTCINPLWAPVLHLAERLGLKMPEGEHRWLPAATLKAMASDAGFETASALGRLLLPKRVPVLSALLNRAARHPALAPVDLLLVLVFAPKPRNPR